MNQASIVAMLIATLLPASARAADEAAKLTAGDGTPGATFGAAVAASNDTMLVGAPGDRGSLGSVYVLTRTSKGWQQQAKLAPADSFIFGSSVAISRDLAVVGAYGDDDRGAFSGSAYVYRRVGTSWIQVAKLLAPDGAMGHLFGFSVAISAGGVLVGAPGHAEKDADAGAVYYFRDDKSVWVQKEKVVAKGVTAGFHFGTALAADDTRFFVSAPGGGGSRGAVYGFERSPIGWVGAPPSIPSGGSTSATFGAAMALSGSTLLIGAPSDTLAGHNSGAAYVFDTNRASSGQRARLSAPDAAPTSRFGSSVAMSNDVAVVGAHLADAGDIDTGAAYVFTRSSGSWAFEERISASVARPGDLFGTSMAFARGDLLVGASADDERAEQAGAVYAFADDAPPSIEATVTPAPNAAGWNREPPVEVSFTCADAWSGVAVCPSATSVGEETSGEQVSGIAVDGAGNTASTIVTVRIDTTPPTLTGTALPAPNAAGWNNTPVVVWWSCFDGRSGLAGACPAPGEVADEGTGTFAAATILDVAGNTSSLAVGPLKIDRTSPTASIDDPSLGLGIPLPAGTLTGEAVDALSGISRVRVRLEHLATGVAQTRVATVVEGRWSLATTGLPPGPTRAYAVATDVASNESEPSATIVFLAAG